MSEQVPSDELRPIVIESDWPTVSIDPPDNDGDLCIELGEENCSHCNNNRTWIKRANAVAIRDWLNKVLS